MSSLSALSAGPLPEALSLVTHGLVFSQVPLLSVILLGPSLYAGALATHSFSSVPAGTQHVEPYHTARDILSISAALGLQHVTREDQEVGLDS